MKSLDTNVIVRSAKSEPDDSRNNRQCSFGYNGLDSTVRDPNHGSSRPNLRIGTIQNSNLFSSMSHLLNATKFPYGGNGSDQKNFESRIDQYARAIHHENILEGLTTIVSMHSKSVDISGKQIDIAVPFISTTNNCNNHGTHPMSVVTTHSQRLLHLHNDG